MAQKAIDKEKNKEKLLSYEMQGVITVEMSYILPMILFVFVLVIHTVFYFHDKNIMIGAAAETAVTGAQMERRPDMQGQTDLSEFYQQRIAGKLILFPEAPAEVEITDQQVTVSTSVSKGRMALEIKQQVPVLNPEEKIRKKRLLESVGGEKEN